MTILGMALAVVVGLSLGFFGGGGSILTVPLLVYVFELPVREAVATSLALVGATSLVSAASHAREGNVEFRSALVFGGTGMVGAYSGGLLGARTDENVLLALFSMAMLVTSVAMWRGSGAPVSAVPKSVPRGNRHARLAAMGLGVGAFTGLVGAGGGFLIVPALVLLAGMPMRSAVGTSLVVIAMNALAGFTGYIGTVSVDVALSVPVAALAIAGSLAGVRLTRRVRPESMRRAFAGLVFCVAVAIIARELGTYIESSRATLALVTSALAVGISVFFRKGYSVGTGRVATRREEAVVR